jgi:hydrogenase nickel incorporation protein HypA/HybF
MHEWALAEAVIATVRRHSDEHGEAVVRSVTVAFGELQKVDREVFRTGLQMLLKGEDLDETVFCYEQEAASFHCNACERRWGFEDLEDMGEDEREAIHFMPEAAHVYMRCPNCGSPDFRVVGGRGVTVKSITMEGK